LNFDRDSRRLLYVDKGLAAEWFKIIPVFEQAFPGSTATIPSTGGYRDPDLQLDASITGASNYDGKTTFSKHQVFPSQGLDYSVVENGSYVKDGRDQRYRWIGEQFESAGFKWGGRFHKAEPDWDHVEVIGPQPARAAVEAGIESFKQASAQTA